MVSNLKQASATREAQQEAYPPSLLHYMPDSIPRGVPVTELAKNGLLSTAEKVWAEDSPGASNQKKGVMDRLRNAGSRLANNIDLINLYGRLKDIKYLFEFSLPFVASGLTNWLVSKRVGDLSNTEETGDVDAALKKAADAHLVAAGHLENGQMGDAAAEIRDGAQQLSHALDQREAAKKHAEEVAAEAKNAKKWARRTVDTTNFLVNFGISWFSQWAEKSSTVKIYAPIVAEEKGIAPRDVKFKDLLQSENQIVRFAAEYYDKKSKIRYATDVPGLVSWAKPEADGVKALLGSKVAFFGWYFMGRYTGVHYESKIIWNKTEGVRSLPNRALNQGTNPGERVSLDDIVTYYDKFQEDFKLGKPFTPDEQLTNRVFRQVARYLNTTYIPKLLTDEEKAGTEGVDFTHAKFTNFVANGGIDIDSSHKTSLLLEIVAHYDNETYMMAFRAAKSELDKVGRENIDAIETIAQRYLGDYWPPAYFREEIWEGLQIRYGGTELAQKQELEAKPVPLYVKDGHREFDMVEVDLTARQIAELKKHYPPMYDGFVVPEDIAESFVKEQAEAKYTIKDDPNSALSHAKMISPAGQGVSTKEPDLRNIHQQQEQQQTPTSQL